MTFKLLVEVWVLFGGLFIVGTAACLPLYQWNFKEFFNSRLWLKIYFWIPIFIVLCLLLYLGVVAASLLAALLIGQAIHEYRRHALSQPFVAGYVALVSVGLLHLPFVFVKFSSQAAAIGLLSMCFASVLSDICAFFAGQYLGKHHLPAFINPGKSYEGVLGQLIGAFLGLAILATLSEVTFSWRLALVVGLASATGDIANSIAKRLSGIKDWGAAIPGHGGVLDRFASLSFAIAGGYWLLAVAK